MRHESQHKAPRRTWTARGLLLLLLSYACLPSYAQKKVNKFEDALTRSREAARIIELLADMPEGNLPMEVIARTQAIAVFPKVTNQTGPFMSAIQGRGVISTRTNDGWTTPAFYQFVGGGYGRPFSNSQTPAILFLFMTKEAVSWFESGGVHLKNEKKAIGGPVGTITNEQRLELDNTQILAYEYHEGTLTGKAFGGSFWKSFSLNPDNKINKPLYRIKGREVLSGRTLDQMPDVPEGILAFKEALEKRFATTILQL